MTVWWETGSCYEGDFRWLATLRGELKGLARQLSSMIDRFKPSYPLLTSRFQLRIDVQK
jgi:hypothetical protein